VFALFLAIILSGGIFFAFGIKAEARENLRVLILRDVPQCRVSGQDLVLRDLKTGQAFFTNKRISSLSIEREIGARLKIHSHPVSAQAFLLTSSRGPLVINGQRYRDKLKVFPGPNRDLWVINELALEDYLVGLINCEISSQWSEEVLKAQAIAARTYALFQKRNRVAELYDVDSKVTDQVYEGIDKEDDRARQVVKETERVFLLYQGHPIFAAYHACCGGKTESPEYLWLGNFPYLQSIACYSCIDSPHFLWNYQATSMTLGKALQKGGFLGTEVLGIGIADRNKSQRVLQVSIQSEKGRQEISGKEFRRLLGYDLLRSTNFFVVQKNGHYLFSGLGWGHGVGLCQWGAKGMAEQGANYRSLLKYYYPGAEIGKIPR